MGGHGGACDADDEGRERVEAGSIAGGLFDPLRVASGSQGENGRESQPPANAFGFDAHPGKTCETEHDLMDEGTSGIGSGENRTVARTAMLMCWICFVVKGSPGWTPKRSIQVLVAP